MESWDRCRFTERRLLVDVAEQHELSVEAAEALDRYSAGRTLDGPVRFGDRSMLTETAEELADAANYLRWEMVRGQARWPRRLRDPSGNRFVQGACRVR